MRADAEATVEGLWRDWHRQVLAYALRRTDAATAQDVVAETFVVVLRRPDAIPDAPLPGLLGIARRVLANRRRGDARQAALTGRLVEQAEDQPSPTPEVDRPLLRALAALGEIDREVLLLVAWDGLTNAEAAQALGCSRAAFDVRAHRARRRLARQLSHTVPESAHTDPDRPIAKLEAKRT